MTDIDVYENNPSDYERFQLVRPDYKKALNEIIRLSEKHTKHLDQISLIDFCCGTALHTKMLEDKLSLERVSLVDINKDFLEIAKSRLKSENVTTFKSDIRDFEPENTYNLNLSVFAYHHVPDNDKDVFIRKIKESLTPGGICVLAEIFLEGEQNKNYYEDVISNIREDLRTENLVDFLMQTSNSEEFEFKVSKDFSDKQFSENGFSLIEEIKIYPEDDYSVGMFVQVYKNEGSPASVG